MKDLIYRFAPLWGKWNVIRHLGEGSYGRVWEVSDGFQLAAVKEITVPSSNSGSLIIEDGRLHGLDAYGLKAYYRAILDASLFEVDVMRRLSDCQNIISIQDSMIKPVDTPWGFGWVLFILLERLTSFPRHWSKGLNIYDVAQLGVDLSHA